MKALYRTGKLTFEVQGETVKQVFAEIASIQDVFEAETSCGVCGSENIRFVKRVGQTADGRKFDNYEIRCMESGCRAKFAFGQHAEGGGLFPQRKDKSNNWLPNNGWTRYEKNVESFA
jgi:hypothetical protein